MGKGAGPAARPLIRVLDPWHALIDCETRFLLCISGGGSVWSGSGAVSFSKFHHLLWALQQTKVRSLRCRFLWKNSRCVCPSVRSSTCLFAGLSLFVCLSTSVSVSISISHLFFCLPAYLSVHPSVCLCVRPCILAIFPFLPFANATKQRGKISNCSPKRFRRSNPSWGERCIFQRHHHFKRSFLSRYEIRRINRETNSWAFLMICIPFPN